MKYRILLFIPAIFLLSMKPEVLKIEDVYEDPANLLMRSEVIDLPGQSITELKSKVENWGETYLANTKELWTDRADKSTKFNCLIPFEVESLIGGGLLTVYYYAVVMVEFKEGKVRYKVYDDGNEYEEETEHTSHRDAHSYHYKEWFGKDGEIENKGFLGKGRYRVVYAFNQKIIEMSNDFKATMLNEKDTGDDW